MTPPTTLAPETAPVTLTLEPVITPPTTEAPVIDPVAETNPAVRMLPPCTLPDTDNALRVPTLVILVCASVVNVPTILVPDKLPPVILPVTLNNPETYSPVVANTATLPVPPTPIVTLPPELTTVTLLVPLLILATLVITPVSEAPLPKI